MIKSISKLISYEPHFCNYIIIDTCYHYYSLQHQIHVPNFLQHMHYKIHLNVSSSVPGRTSFHQNLHNIRYSRDGIV